MADDLDLFHPHTTEETVIELIGRVEDLERQLGELADLVTKLLSHKHMIGEHGGNTTPPFWMG